MIRPLPTVYGSTGYGVEGYLLFPALRVQFYHLQSFLRSTSTDQPMGLHSVEERGTEQEVLSTSRGIVDSP